MKPICKLLLPYLVISICSCTQYAYYQSPFHTNTDSYRTLPLKSDSNRAATYVNGTFTTGGANYQSRDGFNAFMGSVYRAHHFGYFEGYYGLTTTLGAYKVTPYDTISFYKPNNNLDTRLINSMAGGKFFGGIGAIGGLNVVLPLSNGGEWRALGVAANWQHEFGDYLDFRTKLPDTAANIISRGNNFLTISVGTDFVFHRRNGSIGFKTAIVYSPIRLTNYSRDRMISYITPGYLSETFHLSIHKYTGFWQLNTGTYTFSMQLGLNYRIGR